VATIGNVNAATTIITTDNDYSIAASFAYGPAIPLKNPGSFVQMTIRDVNSLDPAWCYEPPSGEQVQYIYETLLFYDGEKTDQFVPVLATEWNSPPDGMTIRLKIRRGVKFHNGGTLTPEDVEYSIERVMVQDRVGGPAWMFFQPLLGAWSSDEVTFADIDNAVEIDGDWVVFHLADPAWGLAFLQILCGPWGSIVDKEWCVANGEWPGTEATWMDFNDPESGSSYLWDKANGTGPWMLEEWDPGIQIKLLRFDDYWREAAPFERVITQIVEEWTTRKAALLAGDADLVYVPRANLDELDSIAGLNVYRDLPGLSIDAFLFNFNIGSESEFIGSGGLDENGIPTDFFTDEDVRKGFCYAFDYEAYINDALLGEGQQVGSPIVEGLPFYNPGASTYSLDLAKAEEHLRAAWGGEVWEKGFELSLLYNAGSTLRNTACEILAQNLAAINPKFHVDILEMDWPTYLDKILRTRDVPMFQMSWTVDYPHPDDIVVPFMDSYGFFAQVQGYGYPELDELIGGAFKELDPAVQEDMYYEIQERYYEDSPGIVLCQPLGRRYFTKYMHGFYFNPAIPGQPGPLYYMSKSS
jgi:peptide/nickel transport system substrate-binding protein